MSCLIVDELYTGIIANQGFFISRDIDLAYIRVGIYKHMNTTADLVLNIKQDGIVVATSKVITTAELNAEMTEDYAYGLVRFEFESDFINLHVKEGEKKTRYEFTVESVGATETSFLGIYRQWTDKIYKICENGIEMDEAVNDMIEPYMYELYEYKYV